MPDAWDAMAEASRIDAEIAAEQDNVLTALRRLSDLRSRHSDLIDLIVGAAKDNGVPEGCPIAGPNGEIWTIRDGAAWGVKPSEALRWKPAAVDPEAVFDHMASLLTTTEPTA